MSENKIIVSVIIPVYNEEKYIENCIQSLIKQTYPQSNMEWIFVDGMSTDNTVNIIKQYVVKYPIQLFENKKKKTPAAMNIGIQNAKGNYIIRFDAHTIYSKNYIEKCIYYLENIDADNVGGFVETKANGFIGKAIAKMLSSKFGVGDSSFRTGKKSGYVDTVPFGAFRRTIFDQLGLFNEDFLRSEDNDFNARIRAAGGKIYLAEDIKSKYQCRDTITGILKMGMQNGNALFRTIKKNPHAMSVRHFIPFIFLLSLIGMPISGIFIPIIRCIFLAEIIVYLLLNGYYSFLKGDIKYGIITIWLYPLFHIFYGLGSLFGLFGIKLY